MFRNGGSIEICFSPSVHFLFPLSPILQKERSTCQSPSVSSCSTTGSKVRNFLSSCSLFLIRSLNFSNRIRPRQSDQMSFEKRKRRREERRRRRKKKRRRKKRRKSRKNRKTKRKIKKTPNPL